MSATFFADRIVNEPKAHAKTFAREVYTAVTVLGAFTDCVVSPKNLPTLTAHVVCFALLRAISAIFTMGYLAIEFVDRLEQLLADYHVKYLELYPQCGKPKLHYIRHVPQCFRKFGVVLSCFGPERKHRLAKRLGQFCFKNCNKTITAHDLREMTQQVQKPKRTQEVVLLDPVQRLDDINGIFFQVGFPSEVLSSRSLSNHRGTFYSGDLILFKDPSTQQSRIILAELFIQVMVGDVQDGYAGFGTECSLCQAALFSNNEAKHELVDARGLCYSLPFLKRVFFRCCTEQCSACRFASLINTLTPGPYELSSRTSIS